MAKRTGRQLRKKLNAQTELSSKNLYKGFEGGRYRPLSNCDMEKIHKTALDILWEIGMKNPLPVLQSAALEHGCRISEENRLCFPHSLVEDVISRATKELVLYGKDAKHDIELSGNRVSSYGAGEAVTVLDPGANNYRPSVLTDVYDIARVVDCLENINSFSRFYQNFVLY